MVCSVAFVVVAAVVDVDFSSDVDVGVDADVVTCALCPSSKAAQN